MIKIVEVKVIDLVGERATDTAQGDILYQRILDAFSDKQQVLLDFAGMKTILSVFLNNALGALYKKYDSKFLNNNLKIKNMSPDDMFILKRVTERARAFFANSQDITNVLDEAFIS